MPQVVIFTSDGVCQQLIVLFVHGHVYYRVFFKANHYVNLNCFSKGIVKEVVGTSENMAEPYYDVMKMLAILNLNEFLLCILITLILGQL